jgi:hypothetical protein
MLKIPKDDRLNIDLSIFGLDTGLGLVSSRINPETVTVASSGIDKIKLRARTRNENKHPTSQRHQRGSKSGIS